MKAEVRRLLAASPVVALLGPRQVGKSTLARAISDLRLDSLDVVSASKNTYALAPRIRAVPLSRIELDVAPLSARRT